MQGDYYQGDFYQGDPGFFSAIGGFFKKAAGAILPSIPGVGTVYSGVRGLLGGGGGGMVRQTVLQPRTLAGVLKAPSRLTRLGAATGILGAGVLGYAGRGRFKGIKYARPGTPLVGEGRRRRRMNVTNVHALRRSIRRAQGFSKLAKRVLRFTSPKPPRGRAVFRVRRRKRTV